MRPNDQRVLPRPDDLTWADGVAEVLPDAVIVVDASAMLVWGNKAAELLFGRTLDDSVGLSGLDFIHPDDLELAAVSLSSVVTKRVGTPLELRVSGVDGWHLVEMVGAPLGDHLVLVLRDLTERRRWELGGDEVSRFRAVLQNAAPVTMLLDERGVVESSSAALTRLLGVDQEWMEGRSVTDLVEGRDRGAILDALASLLGGPSATGHGTRAEVDVRVHRADGSVVPMSLSLANLLDDPTVKGIVATLHDISRRVRTEDDLRETNSLLAATLDATAEGVLVVGLQGRITSFNRRFAEMWRIPQDLLDSGSEEQVLSQAMRSLSDPNAFRSRIEALYADPDAESHDLVEFRDGRVFERDSRPQRVDGVVIGRVWSFRDVTAHRVLQTELAHQASHDPLTGLANQVLFRERVSGASHRLIRPEDRLAVLFIDLDDFKIVNDSFGHSAGDHLLISVSDRLRRCVRRRDTVARMGGDEFAVLVALLEQDSEAVDMARRILAVVSDPIRVAGRPTSASASIGIVFGRAGDSADDLLRNADLAMYVAKNGGRNRYCVYESAMHDAALHRLDVDSRLRGAAVRGELVVQYQPVVETRSGEMLALEALVRWQHPELGLLMPAEFVPLAEETGIIDEIGQHVLALACEEARVWADLVGQDIAPAVAVNLAPRQLLDERLPDRIASHLQRAGVEPARLVLEITEGALMQDPDAATRRLQHLRRVGVRLAVDDFGTGRSSLAHLQRFPIDTLKIDRSLIEGVDRHPGSELVRAIVQLAHTLGMTPVAEGVETESQRAALVDLGCDLAQGYLFARPMDAERTRAVVAGSTSRRTQSSLPAMR